ncbi:Abi-domain-containing protein [Neoconidiobolus thromboides FSU 785]|nr:Abi-domain-containing protein [Neoconidiobolus thromboides FSU 785]
MITNLTFSLQECLLYSSYLSIQFVLPFYLFLKNEEVKLSRNSPVIIIKRFKIVLFNCVLAFLSLIFIVKIKINSMSIATIMKELVYELGLIPINGIYTLISSSILITILFMSSLVQFYIEEDLFFQKNNFKSYFNYLFFNLFGLRAYIIGPFSEEFIFRVCMLLPYIHSNQNKNLVIFYLPLFFGAAHLHHFIENLRFGIPFKKALFQSIFQFIYTTLFGWYATFLFLRTGSLWNLFLSHTFCNMMGLPYLSSKLSSKSLIIVSFLYVLGLVLFLYLLYPLTELNTNLI